MPLWEYCEVAWTPKQITIHVYSGRADGSYEGIMQPKEWGGLLAQLGADGWELVGVVPTKPANHTLYYFKRPIDPPEVIQAEKQERLKAEQEKQVRLKAKQEWLKKLQEWEKTPPETPLRLQNAVVFKSTLPTAESTKELAGEESKTVVSGQEDLDSTSISDSSLPEPQQEP